MLAYLLAYQLRRLWHEVELTVEEGIAELASICAIELTLSNQTTCQVIPEPRPLGKLLLEKADITLPDAIPHKGITVVTRKKLGLWELPWDTPIYCVVSVRRLQDLLGLTRCAGRGCLDF
jgi:hypothetical protein